MTTSDAVPGDRPSIDGVIENSQYLGTSTQMTVNVGDDVKMTVLVPNANEADRQQLPGGGARVKLSWTPENMHLVTQSPDEPNDESNKGETK